MSAPNIKVHIVPDVNVYTNVVSGIYSDVQSSGSGTIYNRAKLIERACDGTLVEVNPSWEYPFFKETLIKLKPITSGSKTYGVDIGVGSGYYHNISKVGFFTECNFAINTGTVGSPIIKLQKWLYNRYSFNQTVIDDFMFQVFAFRESQFLGALGTGGQTISQAFTFVPRFGGFSFNWQESGYPPDGLSYWGQLDPVYASLFDTGTSQTEFSETGTPAYKKRFDWSGGLNYVVDLSNMQLTFSDNFYNNFISNGGNPYEIYIKTFIIRDDNVHSTSLSNPSRSSENVFYALPHYDILEAEPSLNISTNYPISYAGTGWSPGSGLAPIFHKNLGIIEFDKTNYPTNNTMIVVNDYKYHSWIRVTNDFSNDIVFRVYYKLASSKIDVYNFDNNNIQSQGHFNNTGQTQQDYINFTWVDLKITNEIVNNSGNPPNFNEIYLDFLPRAGSYRDNTPDYELIQYGISGLVNEFRPWDHQEGSRSETDLRCFCRVTHDIYKLINSPNSGGSNIWETNPMKQMNVSQALKIKRWYKDTVNQLRKFKINITGSSLDVNGILVCPNDNIMAENQNGANVTTVTLKGMGNGATPPNHIFARLVYLLFDSDDGVIQTATAIKTWSMKITGSYFE